MKKRNIIAIAAVAIVILAGVVTYAAISLLAPKTDSQPVVSEEDAKKAANKKKATDTSKDAKDLIEDTSEIGSGKEADQKTEQAIDKFNEAGKLYEQAGDKHLSLEAKANADALAARLAAEEESKRKLEEEQARQRAQMEAAKKAMEANFQQ